MPLLILVRHGNTFESGETPTFVGGKTDMPLTGKGEAQGAAIAQMIAHRFAPLSGIICGPLLRTHRCAELIAAALNQVFTVDERLCEIDYGLWENKTSAAVREAYGDEIVEAWEKRGTWPEDMNWAPSKQKLEHNVQAILAEQHKKMMMPNAHNRVIVTSNGILRFVYSAVTRKFPDSDAKVATGAYCVLEPTESGWKILSWDQKPA